MSPLHPAVKPTMYFIGVTTKQSSIMDIFPYWSEALHLNADLVGIDVPLQATAQHYRDIVQFIKGDPLSRGALVTTHKIDILTAAKDLIDELDSHAQQFQEISCLAKRGARLVGAAKDPVSSRLALDQFLPPQAWQHGGHALIMGAGGSARAILSCLLEMETAERPQKIYVTDRESQRLQELTQLFGSVLELESVVINSAADHDNLLHQLPSHSLVINATGMGKDRPGSPLTEQAMFPSHSWVWELNYRGSLEFLHHARSQAISRSLTLEDGWVYFIHGWTQVIAEVFQIPNISDHLQVLQQAAAPFRPR